MDKYKYILEPYRLGGGNRYVCPSCGRSKCFTRYVRCDNGAYLDDSCGKCNHENSCGYHLTPREFLHDNPDYQPRYRDSDAAEVAVRSLVKQREFVDMEYVEKSHQPVGVFYEWLSQVAPSADALRRVFDDYRLGALRTGEVVFWQIDADGHVRDGKIMSYCADGHRSQEVLPNWMATKFGMAIGVGADFRSQRRLCFFGEHLLGMRPDDVVALVESEKTALVCAMYYPQYVWVASGGCGVLTSLDKACLTGRVVKVFPDSGMLQKWRKVMAATSGIRYSISPALEQYPSNTDIADVLLAAL